MLIFYVIVCVYLFIDNHLTRKKYDAFVNKLVKRVDDAINEDNENNIKRINVHKKHLVEIVGLLDAMEKHYPENKDNILIQKIKIIS